MMFRAAPVAIAAGVVAYIAWQWIAPQVDPDTDPRLNRVGGRVYFTGRRFPGTSSKKAYEVPSLAPKTGGVYTHPKDYMPNPPPNMAAYFNQDDTAWQSLYFYAGHEEFKPGSVYDEVNIHGLDVPPMWKPGKTIPGKVQPAPYPTIFPEPAPFPIHGNPGRAPSPATKPRKRPRKYPGKVSVKTDPRGGGLTVDKVGPEVTVTTAPTTGRPPPGVTERKVRVGYARILARVLGEALDYLTEAIDFLEVLFEAAGIPAGTPMPEALWMFFAEGYHENVSVDTVFDILREAQEDRLYGRFFGEVDEELADNGIVGGIAI